MRNVASYFFALMLTLVSNFARASYVRADLPSADTQIELGTHIVVAGRGLEAGKAWLMAAHTQALAFRGRAHHGPVQLLAALDPDRADDYIQILQRWGYRNIRRFDVDFTADELIARLREPTLIASLDYVGHDGAFLGLALESEAAGHRFYLRDVKRLAGQARFSPDAFIRLMGCNTGWFLAPAMAQILGVPTRGTLTSADVQLVYETPAGDASWYFDDSGHQPSAVKVAKKNPLSFEVPQVCISGGGCVRMKTVNASYTGLHGAYAGALPFAKFFCGALNRKDCVRRMALSIESLVSVNAMPLASPEAQIAPRDLFAATLADDLCPPILKPSGAKSCRDIVLGHVMGFAPMARDYTTLRPSNPQLACSLKGCAFHVGSDEDGRKVLISDAPGMATTFADEVDAFLEGYALLRH